MIAKPRKTVVVIGNGMVGHRFCERLLEFDGERAWQIVTFCEEPRPAYDRVNLTKYFEHRTAAKLSLAPPDWYRQNRVRLFLGDRVTDVVVRRQNLRVERFPTGEQFRQYFKANYGPTIAAYRNIAGDNDRVAMLDRELDDLTRRYALPGSGVMEWEYLLLTARTHEPPT